MRCRILTRTICSVLLATVYFLGGAGLLDHLLFTSPATIRQRLLLGVLTVFLFSMACVHLVLLKFAWSRPFTIDEAGLEVEGTRITRQEITSCHWGRYSPGTLNIQIQSHGRFDVSVPMDHRAQVEAALRRFGTWDDH
jgi:hypothetical protein